MAETWLIILLWDGVLPLVVVSIPHLVAVLAPHSDILEFSAAIVVPIIAALFRATFGANQIRSLNEGQLPTKRQVALAVAICCLLLFDGYVAMLTLANDEAPSAWIYPAIFFVTYLFAICIALTPASRGSRSA